MTHPCGRADALGVQQAKTATDDVRSPGEAMGGLRDHAELDRVGLGGVRAIPAGTPISAAAIDAHAGVPGAGVGGTGTMVLVLGTSGCVAASAVPDQRRDLASARALQLAGSPSDESLDESLGWLRHAPCHSLPRTGMAPPP